MILVLVVLVLILVLVVLILILILVLVLVLVLVVLILVVILVARAGRHGHDDQGADGKGCGGTTNESDLTARGCHGHILHHEIRFHAPGVAYQSGLIAEGARRPHDSVDQPGITRAPFGVMWMPSR